MNSGIYGLPHTPVEARVVLVPVPFDATTSYCDGTCHGPQAILQASRQVNLFDLEIGRPDKQGISMLSRSRQLRRLNEEARFYARSIIDAGGVEPEQSQLEVVNVLCGQMNQFVYDSVRHWLNQGKLVGLVGGDHSTSFGAIKAHAERYPEMGILQIGAHAGLRLADEGFTWSYASIMRNVMEQVPTAVKLIQIGVRDFCEAEYDFIRASSGRIIDRFYWSNLANQRHNGVAWSLTVEEIVRFLPKQIYISFDIDGLDPSLCPHTGTPVPGGLDFDQANRFLHGVVTAGCQIVGFDLTGVTPGPEGDEWDANVGARLLYKLIGWMLKSQT